MKKVWFAVLIVILVPMDRSVAAEFVRIQDRIYMAHPEFKCHVEKAIPAPERGPTWYTHSSIGEVWLKAEPTGTWNALEKRPSTLGRIRIYRSKQIYEELLVYENAWWTSVDDEGTDDRIQGIGDRSLGFDSKNYNNALFIDASRVTRQGMLYGRDGSPAYFLSECSFTSAFVEIVGEEKELAELALKKARE